MEQKKMTYRQYPALIGYQLKEKKKWFIVSLAIMFITLIAVPYSLHQKIDEASMAIGIIQIATLLFISSLIDYSYLHENRKLSYYASKPLAAMDRVLILFLSNVIYALVLLAFLAFIGLIADVSMSNFINFFLLFVPWVFISLLVATLSAVLTGNTIAAGVATVVNFTLPLSIMGIIYFGFDIVGNLTNGFNSAVLFNLFISNIYRIDLLYFIKYSRSGFSFDYLLICLIWLVVLGSLIYYAVQNRKDERSGDFIVFDGYKNMISVIFASLVPIGFYSIFAFNVNMYNKLLSFLILSGLTFYLIHAILEKTFTISRPAKKIYAGFVILFAAFILTTNVAAKSFENTVPDPANVTAVYFDYRHHIWLEGRERMVEVYQATEEMIDSSPDAFLYRDPEAIENLIGLHKQVIENQNYYLNTSFVLVYFLEDGSKLYRYYNLRQDDDYDAGKDSYLLGLLQTDEFKKNRLRFVYDQEYFDSFVLGDLRIIREARDYSRNDAGISESGFDPYLFRKNLQKDYDRLLKEPGFALSVILFNTHEKIIYTSGQSTDGIRGYYVELIPGHGSAEPTSVVSFRITEYFTETIAYLEALRAFNVYGESISGAYLPQDNSHEMFAVPAAKDPGISADDFKNIVIV